MKSILIEVEDEFKKKKKILTSNANLDYVKGFNEALDLIAEILIKLSAHK